MQIDITQENGKMTIALEGRLDTLTAPQLEAEIQGKLGNVKELIFDFSKVPYISSGGLRILLTAQKIPSVLDDIAQEATTTVPRELTPICTIIFDMPYMAFCSPAGKPRRNMLVR